MKILIVGGGIGGLTAALALHRMGHAVTVLERRPTLEDAGAGIILARNALQPLESLGIHLEACSQPIRRMSIIRHTGQLLSSLDASAVALRRSVLHDALRSCLPRAVRLLPSSPVESIHEDTRSVTVVTPTGEFTGDALIGADGLHSAVRQYCHGPVALRYSGFTCWRDVIPNVGFSDPVEAWGGKARIGAVPLPNQELYVYWVFTALPGAPEWNWQQPTPYSAFGGAFRQLPAQRPLMRHDLWELDSPLWGRGRILLLGDAAHAMTPNQGQGAAMAIEDAIALTHALSGDAASWLPHYVQMRRQRVRKVQLDSRRFGELAHWRHPILCRLRDLAFRCTPSWVLDRHYRQLTSYSLPLSIIPLDSLGETGYDHP